MKVALWWVGAKPLRRGKESLANSWRKIAVSPATAIVVVNTVPCKGVKAACEWRREHTYSYS